MPQHRPQRSKPSLFAWLIHIIRVVRNYVLHKQDARNTSHELAEHALPASIRRELVDELFADLQAAAISTGGIEVTLASTVDEPAAEANRSFSNDVSAGGPANDEVYSDQERALMHRIHHETEIANRNNVTRTEAYRAVYYRSPELQWALLAHLVSRNGGWNMTDLQGELLPELMDEETRRHTFILLERINSLIFHDAYPQLLLYEASRREGKDLSRLLPCFGVSRFMLPVWKQFWQHGDSVLLTTALIVNEQHVIEKPIVQSDYFKAHVLERPMFLMQIPLQTNTVVMPYGSPLDAGGEMMLAGLVLENFMNVKERIEFGKRLYAILICVPDVMEGVMAFVRGVHHTGSRADYAPHLFAKERGGDWKSAAYHEKLEGCALIEGAKKMLSPELSAAWEDIDAALPDRTDWYENADAISDYFEALPLPEIFEITFEHCMALNKLELAVQAKQRFGAHKKVRPSPSSQ
ncbi:DUF2515 domain-containing protein [Paenibacillus rhizovicinus]|uniref:DUF2515 domain-containing protein n=1 Tax=Paenibacillus rhizovicinus TaxID=2704463 RepID=A0A6C0P7N6_9BACL|nr:DUF2515 family protein [Paenibacillus rhizovicinus]QHW34416.1 DUF2515 domain-containing protein [Paenibacillus rhizovicinus]